MAKGAIQFVADSSQLATAAAEARKSVSSVAVSAEEARKKIVASYQLQIKAATEAGASQRQLDAITRQSTGLLAAVTEDTARRYVNAVDRMEDRTRRFNAARSTLSTAVASAPVSSFTFGGFGGAAGEAQKLSHAIEGVGKAAEYSVAPSVRFGSILRGMEGSFSRNIRAAEYFGASLKSLAPIVEVAFPIVGAATLGYALLQMGRHAYEAFQNVVMLRDAIAGLNKLQINVASTVNRDRDAAETSVESILEATQGKSAALKQKYSYQSQKPIDLSQYFYSDEFKKLPTDVKANYETLYKSVAPADVPARLQSIRKEITAITSAQDLLSTSGMASSIGGYGPGGIQNPASYYQARLKAAQQIQQQLESGSTAHSASLQGLQVSIPEAQKQEQEKRAQESATARQKALDAQKKADAEQVKQLEAAHLAWQSVQTRSLGDETAYWAARLVSLQHGSSAYLDAIKKLNTAIVALNRQNSEAITSFRREYLNDFQRSAGLTPDDVKSLDIKGGASAERIAALRDSITLNKQNSTAIAEASIQMELATGRLTRLGAAQALAALHQHEYVDSMRELKEEAAGIATDQRYTGNEEARQAAAQRNANQQAALTGQYSIQRAYDAAAANPVSTSGLGGARDALDEFVVASRDAASQMRDFGSNVLGGLNRQFVEGISGRRTNFGNFGADVFRNVAGIGLEKAEGSILGAFGFGSAAKMGTRSNPIYTISATAGAVSSVAGGILGGVKSGVGGILKGIIPFLAAGGPLDAGTMAMVGENGPELFMPGVSGTVIPNNKISSMVGSGDTHHHYNIDARGSTDPAQVNKQIMDALPKFVQVTSKAIDERRLRRPSSYH